MNEVDVLIIGGGPAGLAAALSAREAGCSNILILEREQELGGILRQCIHPGFGLHIFKEELTGPEYAARYVKRVLESGIPYETDTMVIDITPDRVVTTVSRKDGLRQIRAKSIVLAMGCRERPRGALGIPGSRCAGIFSAGTAQRFVNLEGELPGKRIVILGSGDIGLIMARRLTFAGAKVLAAVELMPYSSGLTRNVVQCLNDYDIPLMLSHTVTEIRGKDRLEAVVISEVDGRLKPIPGTERVIECDTLLLSVGLIPENELSKAAGVELDGVTGGPVVNDRLGTNVAGIFACGNVLHVHDLVDNVSEESERAGRYAAEFALGHRDSDAERMIAVRDGAGVRGLVPQLVSLESLRNGESVNLMFRPANVYQNAFLVLESDGQPVKRFRRLILTPGEMQTIKLDASMFGNQLPQKTISVSVEM
ncbi:MAG: FAD-dependent oxidoreductase [Lentisphaerae bacterium]|jgi:NADPH-dependent 2,4-dienoyl-CoA reductase/sulfur reductase-like enzyme|nr:FAD-dependent oxidoreductase [Lentisphaerota bacterium]